MTVSLLEILAAARAHAAPLAAESAGYLLLAVADQLALSPRMVDAEAVELHPDGSVRLHGRGSAISSEQAERLARQLLARVLEVSSSVGPSLRRAAERRELSGLDSLVRELEVALIPVNRSAARRALSRLHREASRARDQGKLEALLRAEQARPAAAAELVALAADFPEAPSVSVTPAPALPVVVAAPGAAPAPAPARTLATPVPARVAPQPPPELMLSPPPLPAAPQPAPTAPSRAPATARAATAPAATAPAATAPTPAPEPVEEPVLTKPEPVVERARERGSSTPKLGTVITAQTLLGEDLERTERAPAVAVEEPVADELDVPIEVELEPAASVEEAQPLLEPSPSRLPDVLMAMVKVHAGLDPEDAPTRLRDVTTAIRPPAFTPEPALVEDAWLTQSSLEHLATETPDPAVYEALTWNPGAVAPKAATAPLTESAAVPVVATPEPAPAFEAIPDLRIEPARLPETLLIAEPVELSPYAPAVLPGRESDVSELLDSFHVSSGVEERELRAALKDMAGLDLTPLPRPYAQGE